MNSNKIAVLHIVVALIFAGIILVSSWLMGDSDNDNTFTVVTLAAWMIVSGFLNSYSAKK